MADEQYFVVGVFQPKRQHNMGTLWRSALQLGASGVFTIGRRYERQGSDTFHTTGTIPLKYYLSFQEFLSDRETQWPGATLIGIEMGGTPLKEFHHPGRAIYLLGSEDNGLPAFALEKCQEIVSLQAVNRVSYNLAVSGSIVLYHRCFL